MTNDLKAMVRVCLYVHEGITLRELAKKTRLSPSTLSRLRRGRYTTAIRYSTVRKLAVDVGLQILWERMK